MWLKQDQLVLVGRQASQLDIIAKDIRLRYPVSCEVLLVDLATQTDKLLTVLQHDTRELDVFIAHSDFTDNLHLNTETITQLIKTNILTTTLLIHSYFNRSQKEYHLLFLSSVAACRGRAKTACMGRVKQVLKFIYRDTTSCVKNQHITIARLGFIDTKQTYGVPGVFYAASPYSCAQACLKALNHKKNDLLSLLLANNYGDYYPLTFFSIKMGSM